MSEDAFLRLYSNLRIWSLNALEDVVYWNLERAQDPKSVKACAVFSATFRKPIRIYSAEIRRIILNTDISSIEDPYRRRILQAVEGYLFDILSDSNPDEWRSWLRATRLAQRPIRFSRNKIAQGLWQAFQTGKLDSLASEERAYLFSGCWLVFGEYLEKRGVKDHPEILPLLLRLHIKRSSLTDTDFKNWVELTYRKILEERLARARDNPSLTDLIVFLFDHDQPFPIQHAPVRDAVFSVESWSMPSRYLDSLFACVEEYLVNGVATSNPAEWQVWFKQCRLQCRPIRVQDRRTARALEAMRDRFGVDFLPELERNFWLGCYKDCLASTLVMIKPSDQSSVLEKMIRNGPIGNARKLPKAVVVTYEEDLEGRLVRAKDNRSLTDLAVFSFDHRPPFPIQHAPVRDAALSVESWNMPPKYLESLFGCVEEYLVDEVATSKPSEWRGWFKQCRLQHRPIRVRDGRISQALEAVRDRIGVDFLPKSEYDFWLDCYREPLSSTLSKIKTSDQTLVLDRLVKTGPIGNIEDIPEFMLVAYKDLLQDRFIQDHSCESLESLLEFSADHDPPFPIHDPRIRDALLDTQLWGLDDPSRVDVLTILEDFLTESTDGGNADEWQFWIRASRLSEKAVDVTRGRLALAVRNAHFAGKLDFDELPGEDYRYLLEQYHQAYGNILAMTQPEDQDVLLASLLQFGCVAQLLGPSEEHERILRYWANNLYLRPRALAEMENGETLCAPIHGVGSPNGISVTIFHNEDDGHPRRICTAGISGDAVLNDQILTGLFAHALNCNVEKTFLSVNGVLLTLEPENSGVEANEDAAPSMSDELKAILDWRGAGAEPVGEIPTLGMDDQESLQILVDGLLAQAAEETGIVRITHWSGSRDGQNLEADIENAMKAPDPRPAVLTSEDAHLKTGSIIHIMPLYHRDQNGGVVPFEVELPNYLFGRSRIFDLLRQVRHQYLANLIEAANFRELEARYLYDITSEQVNRWQRLTEAEKQQKCAARPFEDVYRLVDLAKGITHRLVKPLQVAQREYQESKVPWLRADAKAYAERFAALRKKLANLDADGGSADLLTFGLLVDALIRQAPLRLPNSDVQTEYENWVQQHFAPVWAAIEYYARDRGLSGSCLAADNVLFRSKANRDKNTILIQPWVAVDLQNFRIIVDREKGLMRVTSTGKVPTLQSVLIPDDRTGVANCPSLHAQFMRWSTTWHHPQERLAEIDLLFTPNVKKAIRLYRSKALLSGGQVAKADRILHDLCTQGCLPAFYWRAVSRVYQSLDASLGTARFRLSEFFTDAFLQYVLSGEQGVPEQFALSAASCREQVFAKFLSPGELSGVLRSIPFDSQSLLKKKPVSEKLLNELLTYSAVSDQLDKIRAIGSVEDVAAFLTNDWQVSESSWKELLPLVLSVPEAQRRASAIVTFIDNRFSRLYGISPANDWLRAFLGVRSTDVSTPEGQARVFKRDPVLKEYLTDASNDPAGFVWERKLKRPEARAMVDALISCDSAEAVLEFLLSIPAVKEEIDQIDMQWSPESQLQEVLKNMDQQAQDHLRRLIALDRDLAQSLADATAASTIIEKGDLALGLTDGEKRLLDDNLTLACVELFYLAEAMKETARSLPFRVASRHNVQTAVERIIQQTHGLVVDEPSPSTLERVEALGNLVPR